MDTFLRQIVEKSVRLEAWDAVINGRSTPPDGIVQKTVKKLWEYSCVTGASSDLESELQAGLVNVDSPFVGDDTSPVYAVCPTSILLQRCVSLAATYASMIMVKNLRWKNFRTMLLSLASEFVNRASDVESKSEQKQSACRRSSDFSAMFHSIIESNTDVQLSETPTSSHFREAACYLMLAGVVARSRFNSPGEGSNFHLNNSFRENVSMVFVMLNLLCIAVLISNTRSGNIPQMKRCASITPISLTGCREMPPTYQATFVFWGRRRR